MDNAKVTLDEVGVGYWSWDLATNSIFLSPAWKMSLGYDRDHVSDDSSAFGSLLHSLDRFLFQQEINAVKIGQKVGFDCVYRMKHKDGTYRWHLGRGAKKGDVLTVVIVDATLIR